MKSRGFLFLCVFLAVKSYAWQRDDFSAAVKEVRAIFESHPQTLYCGCSFDSRLKLNQYSCTYENMQSSHKAETVSIVHLMAVEKFGQYFSCWKHPRCLSGKGRRYGGYKCCQLSSKTFRKLNGELYNLWPSIRYFEKLRKQTKWSSEKTGERILGCDVWSDRALMTMTPGDPAKGVIARATLFMSDFYNIPLSEKERILMFSWHTLNPPSQWEKEWARKVSQIEGYQNPYILS